MQKFIIFLSLISLSLQVDHCFIEQKISKKCKQGYFLVENSFCSKIEHCSYINGDFCSDWESDYYLDSTKPKCLEGERDHCTSYNPDDTTKCMSCEFGYHLNSQGTGCIQTIELWVSYGGPSLSICQYCDDGYALNNVKNKCVKFPGWDEVNEDESKCIDSSEDFYQPDKDGKCVIDYCKDYDSDGNCEECEKYFFLNKEGKCQYIPIPYCTEENETYCEDYDGFVEDEDPNKEKEEYEKMCESQDNNGICNMCKPGYELDATTKECVSNCEEFEEPSPYCKYCEHGYILVDGHKTCYSVLGGGNEEDGIDFIKLSRLLNLVLILLNY